MQSVEVMGATSILVQMTKHGSTGIPNKKLGDLIDLEGLLIDISLSSFQTNPQFCTAMWSSLYNGPVDALLRYYQSLKYEFICFISHY